MEDKPFDLHSLPKCDNLFELGREIGSGVTSKVHTATEKRSGRIFAVKIVKLTPGNEEFAMRECQILTQLPKHDNIIDIYDVYVNNENSQQELWIVMELCAGTAIDFVRKMHEEGRMLDNAHLAHILKGLIQAVIHLHGHNVIHRDVRGSNILITKDGEVRLSDFGVSAMLRTPSEAGTKRIGSPSWMAPEMIPAGCEYDNRVDVWAMGITAIELAEGKAPFENMHPARALFQVSRNPPPGLTQPPNNYQILCDFINECLEKNPNNRPVIQEFLEHPLLQENDGTVDAKADIMKIMKEQVTSPSEKKYPEVLIRGELMQIENEPEEKILHDDLAMLEHPTEEAILKEIEDRLKKKQFCTFIGDILLLLNPNEERDIYGEEYHRMYRLRARSENPPHVYCVADSAYQDVVHHEEPQQVLITGETMSGKTTTMLHILHHLLYLGQGNKCGQNVQKSVSIIHALGNAGTASNPNSTRHILQTQVSFTATGKTSGAIFWIYQLEKNRITSTDRNFHIFYYFYNALQCEGALGNYFLEGEKSYEFLRNGDKKETSPKEYAKRFAEFETNLTDLGFEAGDLKTIRRVLAAILILGEVEFEADADGNAKLATQNEADAVADLLGLDQKKFSWALLKYCVILKGEAAMRYHTDTEANEAKNVLARGLYFRLVDWIVNTINEKLSIPRVIYGDKYTVNILDLFGFECFNTNTIDQLVINCMNEQLQYYYSQKTFSWEMKNAEEEEITLPSLTFNDNKVVMDQLLSKPEGLMHLIDDATKNGELSTFTDKLKDLNNSHISVVSKNEFSVAHYTGKITYKASEVLERNRDFLPPEMIETMRRSSSDNIRKLFTGLLTSTGNLTMQSSSDKMDNREGRWNTGFSSSNKKFRGRKFNTSSKGQYSQSRQMRTAATTFRATCLELLRSLTSHENNVQFVKCVRPNMNNSPFGFQRDMVRQQMRAFGALETVLARQKGYSYRVTFSDFIRRYRFLAFDFNENVDETRENCRLLFIRLKMEGWVMGKTKVFLKYCDKEYLSRLYGMNVRKIVKVQSMMRSFLARRNLRKKIARFQENIDRPQGENNVTSQPQENEHNDYDEDEDGKSITEPFQDLDSKTIDFIKPWFRKWRMQSMYQVLLLYRSTQQRNLVYFSQQVHIYNQNNRSIMEILNESVNLEQLDLETDVKAIFPEVKISIHKTPFKLGDFPYFDNFHMCPKIITASCQEPEDEPMDEDWDSPLKPFLPKHTARLIIPDMQDQECQTDPYNDDHSISSSQLNSDKVATNASKIGLEQSEDINSNKYVSMYQDNTGRSVNELNHVRKPPKYVGIGPKKNSHTTMKIDGTNNNDVTQVRNANNLRQMGSTDEGQKFKTPIRELNEKFKIGENCVSGEEDPPYNFRAMLRKTNYSDPENQRKSEWTTNSYDFTLRKKLKKVSDTPNQRQITSTEIAPGVIVHGEVTDL